MKTVIGLFDSAADAYAAQNELLNAGIARDRISVVTNRSTVGTTDAETTDKTEAAEGAGIGATAGALAGGAAGILASLGLLAIPGIGPLLAAGPIVAALTGAGVGAAAGGLLGGLIGLGIPAHEAEIYEEGVNRGGTLVSVDSEDSDAARVARVLSSHNAIDIDKRAAEWESTGWTRKNPVPSSYAPSADIRARGTDRAVTPDNTGNMGTTSGTGGMDPSTSDIGSSHRRSTSRIYNP